MPLLEPSAPPGFPPKTLVAPEVFEDMQLYLKCTDMEERRIREHKLKMALRELSSNHGAQSSYLRLEDHPRISSVHNKDLGRVFDFRTAETDEVRADTEHERVNKMLMGEAGRGQHLSARHDNNIREGRLLENPFMSKTIQTDTNKQAQEVLEGSGEHLPLQTGVIFSMGHDAHSMSGVSGRSNSSKRKGSSWKRLRQTPPGGKGVALTEQNREVQEEGDSSAKRKAGDGAEVSSKLSKQSEGLIVHQKPSTPQ